MALNTFAASKFKVGDLYYSIISEADKTVKVEAETAAATNYSKLTECTIPAEITYNETTYAVTEIAYNAFNNVANLISVTIPATIVNIEATSTSFPEWNVFYNSLKLNSIGVDAQNPNYMSIDGVLFTKDKKMLISYPTTKDGIKYRIPDGVEKIGTYAFNGCLFSEIVLPSTLTKLCMAAFHNCSKVTTVVCYAPPPQKRMVGLLHIRLKNFCTYRKKQ